MRLVAPITEVESTMADYEIGGFLFSFPIWVLGQGHKPDSNGKPTSFNNFVTLDVDGKKCLIVFTDGDAARSTLQTAIDSGRLRMKHMYALSIDTPQAAFNVLRDIAKDGTGFLTFDPIPGAKPGETRVRPPFAISDLIAVLDGTAAAEYRIGTFTFKFPLYLLVVNLQNLEGGGVRYDGIATCEAGPADVGSQRHKFGILFTDRNLLDRYVELHVQAGTLPDNMGNMIISGPLLAVHVLTEVSQKQSLSGYVFDPDVPSLTGPPFPVRGFPMQAIVEALTGSAPPGDYRIADLVFQFPLWALLTNSLPPEEGDQDRYNGAVKADAEDGRKCVVLFTNESLASKFADLCQLGPSVRLLRQALVSPAQAEHVLGWIGANVKIDGVMFDPHVDGRSGAHKSRKTLSI